MELCDLARVWNTLELTEKLEEVLFHLFGGRGVAEVSAMCRIAGDILNCEIWSSKFDVYLLMERINEHINSSTFGYNNSGKTGTAMNE